MPPYLLIPSDCFKTFLRGKRSSLWFESQGGFCRVHGSKSKNSNSKKWVRGQTWRWNRRDGPSSTASSPRRVGPERFLSWLGKLDPDFPRKICNNFFHFDSVKNCDALLTRGRLFYWGILLNKRASWGFSRKSLKLKAFKKSSLETRNLRLLDYENELP